MLQSLAPSIKIMATSTPQRRRSATQTGRALELSGITTKQFESKARNEFVNASHCLGMDDSGGIPDTVPARDDASGWCIASTATWHSSDQRIWLGNQVVIGGYSMARSSTTSDHARNGKDSIITSFSDTRPTFETTNSRSPIGG